MSFYNAICSGRTDVKHSALIWAFCSETPAASHCNIITVKICLIDKWAEI